MLVVGQAAFFADQILDLSPSLNDKMVPTEKDVGGGEVTEAFAVAGGGCNTRRSRRRHL